MDQEARLQLVYETGQRPEERIATLGHRVDSREQVAEFFFFLHSRRLPSQLDTKSVPRRVRLAIERNIVVMSLDQTFQSGIQRENVYLRTVGGVALYDESYDLNGTEAQEDTVRACGRANPGKSSFASPGLPGRAIWDSA